ncbi:MAG: hypothetical protein JWN48_5889 [Myxococcaceae bacterium]|nr:hypothetical protein [Myxococcaceae bacterium]
MARVSLSLSFCFLLSSSACEVVADFDPNKLNVDRTIGPVPIPDMDASALIPDAALDRDGALIQPEVPDAQVALLDGGDLDAALVRDAAVSEPDGALEDGSAALGNDAAAGFDIDSGNVPLN